MPIIRDPNRPIQISRELILRKGLSLAAIGLHALIDAVEMTGPLSPTILCRLSGESIAIINNLLGELANLGGVYEES